MDFKEKNYMNQQKNMNYNMKVKEMVNLKHQF